MNERIRVGDEKIIFPGAPRQVGKRVLMSEDTEFILPGKEPAMPGWRDRTDRDFELPSYPLWQSKGTPQEVWCTEQVGLLRRVWHRIKEWFGYPPYEPLRWMETRIVWSTPEQVPTDGE